MPTSHASCPRQTTSPCALRPVSGSTSRTCRRSGTSAPITAMQPEWLTSTVNPFAVRRASPSSHSRRKRRLAVARGWERMLAQRSSIILSCESVCSGVNKAMRYLTRGCLQNGGPPRNLNPCWPHVNGTFAKKYPALHLFGHPLDTPGSPARLGHFQRFGQRGFDPFGEILD